MYQGGPLPPRPNGPMSNTLESPGMGSRRRRNSKAFRERIRNHGLLVTIALVQGDIHRTFLGPSAEVSSPEGHSAEGNKITITITIIIVIVIIVIVIVFIELF